MYNGLFISLLGFQSGYFEENLRYFLFDLAEIGPRVDTLFFILSHPYLDEYPY